MSGLADLQLKTAYRKGEDDIAKEFYLPCMCLASQYDRAVGFFNSAIYVIAWPSLRDFVQRGGKMRLICSPILSPQDIEAIETGYSERFESDNGNMLREEVAGMLATPYLHKPTTVLASLVALGAIEIKIAFVRKTPKHERLFHDKLGLFHDSHEHVVGFKGSMNETWAGLSADGNLESVDVFLSWEDPREAGRVRDDARYFNALWSNEYQDIGVAVKPFPEVARGELLNSVDVQKWPDLVDEICREIEAADRFQARPLAGGRILRPHQSFALSEWAKKNRRGIFEHATGSGKTFTALSAMRPALTAGEVPLVLVPSELLLEQWYREISTNLQDMSPEVLRCGAGYTKWRDQGLIGPWSRSGTGLGRRIVLSTMQTAASPEFRAAIRQGEHLFMVADEVHRMGSTKNLDILSLNTGPRLGLSATPRRANDPVGTSHIFSYFEGIVQPPFTLKDAIASKALTPYLYHVHTAQLSQSEQDEWDRVTKRIRSFSARNASARDTPPFSEDQIKRLLIERARILKQAEVKASLAAAILSREFQRGQRWIVYCDDLNQLREVQKALRAQDLEGIEYYSSMPGDKEQTIRFFEATGGIIVSIRCLDEGVDIPSVTHALILASSRNPREFIQRRGRVLRTAAGKSVAYIHDMLVLPLANPMAEGTDEDPRLNILGGELSRSVEFGRWALNPSAITDLQRIALTFTTDYQELLAAGYEDEEEE